MVKRFSPDDSIHLIDLILFVFYAKIIVQNEYLADFFCIVHAMVIYDFKMI